MSVSPLLLNPKLEFEKTAADARLSESTAAWPAEALAELYKQAPFVSDFDPHVVLQRVEADRGFAFGHVLLSIPGEVTREARIPLIVREKKLCPFDLLVLSTSKVTPLTKDRVRQAIFRPEMFDAALSPPDASALTDQLYPTGDGRLGGDRRGTVRDLGGKHASPLTTVLRAANEDDVESFAKAAAGPEVRLAMESNGRAVSASLRKVAESEPARPGSRAEPIDVVQFSRRGAGRYRMKCAARAPFAPRERQLDRAELVEVVGEKVAAAVDIGGSVTLASGGAKGSTRPVPGDDSLAPIHKSGVYRVRDLSGNELLGAAIVGLFDERGKKVPLTLFTSGAARALQTDIVGRYVGACVVPVSKKVAGKGFFFSDAGEVVDATIPFSISGKTTSPSGEVHYHAEAFGGGPVVLVVQSGIAEPVRAAEGKLLIPAHYKWSSLSDAVPRALQSQEPEAATKQAAEGEVTIRGAGDRSFSIDGPPVDALARSERHFLDEDGARFLLGAMGVADEPRETLLAAADTGREPVEARVPLSLSAPEASEAQPSTWPTDKVATLRSSLVKEAAVIPDRTAVDTVLSLGFLNDENILELARHLPEIEEAVEKMCELLLATRLGLKDIPEAALERAIRSTETVRSALRVMAFKKV